MFIFADKMDDIAHAILAIQTADVTKLATLIKAGLSVNEENNHGSSLLAIACEQHSLDCAQLLIQNGADIDEWDTKGHTQLTHICALDETYTHEILFLYHEDAELDMPDREGLTALMHAASRGNNSNIQTLCGIGADINLRNTWQAPIFWAADGEYFSSVAKLLACGADPDIQCDSGTILMHCLHLYPQTTKMDVYMPILLNAGVDINIGEDGMSPFLYAIANQNVRWAEELILRHCHIYHVHEVKMPRLVIKALDMSGNIENKDKLNKLVFGSGESFLYDNATLRHMHPSACEAFWDKTSMKLAHIARKFIRQHLKQHRENLIVQVAQLPIPSHLKNFLLYQ